MEGRRNQSRRHLRTQLNGAARTKRPQTALNVLSTAPKVTVPAGPKVTLPADGAWPERQADERPVAVADAAASLPFTVEPMPRGVPADAASAIGCVVTNDMCLPQRVQIDRDADVLFPAPGSDTARLHETNSHIVAA